MKPQTHELYKSYDMKSCHKGVWNKKQELEVLEFFVDRHSMMDMFGQNLSPVVQNKFFNFGTIPLPLSGDTGPVDASYFQKPLMGNNKGTRCRQWGQTTRTRTSNESRERPSCKQGDDRIHSQLTKRTRQKQTNK